MKQLLFSDIKQLVYLSKKDSQVFFDVLDNPQKPNNKLKNAFENYKNKIDKTCN